MGANNAFFCSGDNTIYYDQDFMAARMKAAAAALHSDGDYAPVVILAHEWGHAAGYWYGQKNRQFSWQTFAGEQLADCLAGVVTRSAERAGKLATGDVAEAEFTIQSGGRVDLSKLMPIGPNRPKTISEKLDDDFRKYASHGEPADRLRAFRKGYRGTAQACLADLKLGGY
jgi:predicted metalloprotease